MSFDLKVMVSTVHNFTTHRSTLQHPPFGVCPRHFSSLRWKNSRTHRSPTGLHGGITLATRAFLGSQHYSVTNSYKLESVPRRLRSPCPSHRSRTAQRLQAPCPHCSRHSAPSAHKFWRAPQAMSAHRRGHAALFYQTPLPAQSSTTYSSRPPVPDPPCSCTLRRRLFRTGLLLPMRPPSYRSRSPSIYLGIMFVLQPRSSSVRFGPIFPFLSFLRPFFLSQSRNGSPR